MSFYINNKILQELENEVRKLHGKLIVGIAHDVLKNPSLIPEMKRKYLNKHPKSNLTDTIRPPRKYMDEEQEEIIELKTILTQLDIDTYQEIDAKDRCIYMVRVNRKIRQCKHMKILESEFCTYHCDEMLYPYGLKEIDNSNQNDFISDDDDDEPLLEKK